MAKNRHKIQSDLFNSIMRFRESMTALRGFVDSIEPAISSAKPQTRYEKKAHATHELFQIRTGKLKASDAKIARLLKIVGGDFELHNKENGGALRLRNISHQLFSASFKAGSRPANNKSILLKMSLVNLASTAEVFLGEVLAIHCTHHPNQLKTEIPLCDIVSAGSIEAIAASAIDKFVRSTLSGSFSDWVSIIAEKTGVSAEQSKQHMDLLTETFQRRHIIIHNGSKIDSSYLAKTKKNYQPPEGKKNVHVDVDIDYLNSRMNILESCMITLGMEYWFKFNDDADEIFLQQLLLNIFDSIHREHWDLSILLYTWLSKQPATSLETRSQSLVNLWQCYKWKGDFHVVETDVCTYDFSAHKKIYELCRQCLLEDYEKIFPLLETCLQNGELNVQSFFEWPIFQDLRKKRRAKTIIEPYQDRFLT